MIEPRPAQIDQQQPARELVEKARADGVDLAGPGGLLSGLTKSVLETALEAEMSEHLGYDKHEPAGRNGGNSRNGTRAKTALSEFGPAIVRKRQRRLDGIGQIVLSLTARGLTTGEIAARFDEVYGAKAGKDIISRITGKAVEEMAERRTRPPDRVYPVISADAIVVKARDGQVVSRPVYVVIGVTVSGERDIPGLWAGDGGEGAKSWLPVLTEIPPGRTPRFRRALMQLTLGCTAYSNTSCEASDTPGAERAQSWAGTGSGTACLPFPRLSRRDGRGGRRRGRVLPWRRVLPVRRQGRPVHGAAGAADDRARGADGRAGGRAVRGGRRGVAPGRGSRPGLRRSLLGAAADRVPRARRP